MSSSLKLTARCWECGSKDLIDGLCTNCEPGTAVVPANPVKESIYDRQPVWQMMRNMRESNALESIDHEIAAMRSEAQRLLDMEDMGLRAPMSEADRVFNLRQLLQSIVESVAKRQKIIAEGKYLITIDFLRVYLGEVERILRKYVKDEVLLREIGVELSSVAIKYTRDAKP